MRRRAHVASAWVTVVAAVVVACSTMPTQPPIDTTGPTTPSGGGGPPAEDGGGADAGSADAETPVTPEDGGIVDAANNCRFGTCPGCCSSPDSGGQCLVGASAEACGTGGVGCAVCTLPQVCVAMVGCQ